VSVINCDKCSSFTNTETLVTVYYCTMAPFDSADKPAEKHCWLICYERKTFFRLKKQAKKDRL